MSTSNSQECKTHEKCMNFAKSVVSLTLSIVLAQLWISLIFKNVVNKFELNLKNVVIATIFILILFELFPNQIELVEKIPAGISIAKYF